MRADGGKPANALLAVVGGAYGDGGVLRAPAGTLPYPLVETAQHEVQAPQVTAAPTALAGILGGDCLAWHVRVRQYQQSCQETGSLTATGTTQPTAARWPSTACS